jgi:hypothetical protein
VLLPLGEKQQEMRGDKKNWYLAWLCEIPKNMSKQDRKS